MINNKPVGLIAHPFHQLIAFGYNGFSKSPGKYSGKQTTDLNILKGLKSVRYGDGITRNKIRGLILFDIFV